MAVAIPSRSVHVAEVMGTVVSLDARGVVPSIADDAFERVMAWLREVDERFSPYRPDSEISRIDRAELSAEAVSPDVRWVLDRCAAVRAETRGAFDEYAAGRLDPSAFVKGWAVERAAELLVADGLTDFSLGAGGDIVVRGGALPERVWRVGIQHPRERRAIAAALPVTDIAVTTSGTYERGEHILDPHSGAAPRGVLSVTVIGPDLGLADAYSTAAFALGIDGPEWTLGLDGYESMTILADDCVLCTPGFPAEDVAV